MHPQILVIRTGAIGDTIVMSVVYQALRRHFPHASIEALGAMERLRLIHVPGYIDKITSIEAAGFAALFVADAPFPERLRAYLQRFDMILCYTFDPDHIVTNNLCKISAGHVYRFDPFPPQDANRHITAYLLDTLAVLGIAAQPLLPEIALPESAAPFPYSQELRVAMHPGSGSAEKNWAAANFAALAARLVNRYQAKIVLLAGPAETENVQFIAHQLSPQALMLLRNLPLPAVAAELCACHLYIGNDSGLSHLAAAVGLPTIALFGPSNPQVWRPIGKQVVVLQGDARPYCVGISVEQVFAAVAQFLG